MDALEVAADRAVPGVPDVAGVVVGWRAWRVVARPGGPELVAPVQGTRWPPGRATHARCTSGRHDAADVPAEDCRCGLYAVADPAGVVGHDGPGAVLGCVALYGEVLEGTQGWRASRGVPRLLVVGPDVDGETRAGLAERYGVRVRCSTTSLTALTTGLSRHRARADAVRDAVAEAVNGTAPGGTSPAMVLDDVLRELRLPRRELPETPPLPVWPPALSWPLGAVVAPAGVGVLLGLVGRWDLLAQGGAPGALGLVALLLAGALAIGAVRCAVNGALAVGSARAGVVALLVALVLLPSTAVASTMLTAAAGS